MSFHIPAHLNTKHPAAQVAHPANKPVNVLGIGDRVEHLSTGKKGVVIGLGIDYVVVNFGGNPFRKVDTIELRRIDEPSPLPPDFVVENHGSICLLRCKTEAARAWVIENAPHANWWAGSIVVEPRYIESVVDGIEGDGLIVA